MKIPKLLALINEFVNGENLSDKEKKSLASNIKRQYNMTIQELRGKGREISIQDLRSLISPLIENYEDVKEFNSLNETIQIMANDLATSPKTSEKNREEIGIEVEKIHAVVLGNPGTSIKDMSSDYIAKIIRRKLTKADGINRDDIINVLNMQAENMYLDIEEYQKLINDSLISYLTHNTSGKEFSNPKILGIFESLASSYKIQGDFENAKKAYELGLRIKSLEKTPEYRDLEKNYQRFLEFIEMKQNFDTKRFSSFNDLMNSLNQRFTRQKIFPPATQKTPLSTPPTIEPTQPPTQPRYVMPVQKKLKALEVLVRALKKEDPRYDLVECEVGKDKYDGYVIIRIENSNVSIFENFNEVNARIFIVENEKIDQVKQLARNDAITIDGVEAANHLENFDNYCGNLIKKTKRLINATRIGSKHHDDGELVFDEENVELPIEELLEDEDEKGVEDRQETESNDKTEQVHEEVGSDKVELERKKAVKNREKLHKLEQRLNEIQEDTKSKIEEIRSGSEHSEE